MSWTTSAAQELDASKSRVILALHANEGLAAARKMPFCEVERAITHYSADQMRAHVNFTAAR